MKITKDRLIEDILAFTPVAVTFNRTSITDWLNNSDKLFYEVGDGSFINELNALNIYMNSGQAKNCTSELLDDCNFMINNEIVNIQHKAFIINKRTALIILDRTDNSYLLDSLRQFVDNHFRDDWSAPVKNREIDTIIVAIVKNLEDISDRSYKLNHLMKSYTVQATKDNKHSREVMPPDATN